MEAEIEDLQARLEEMTGRLKKGFRPREASLTGAWVEPIGAYQKAREVWERNLMMLVRLLENYLSAKTAWEAQQK